jgi:4-amino-4-deoxy-L-arabinose transferase-like glycosyltransferase
MTAALVAALAVRVAFAFGFWNGKPLTNDEQEYLLLAQSVASGRGVEYPDTPESNAVAKFGRAPGYPVFLAPLVGAGPLAASVPASVKLAQCLLGAAGALAIGLLARRAAGDRAGVWASFLAAFYPPLVWLSGYALSESLYSPFILGATLLVARLTDRADESRNASLGFAVLTGVALGAAALIRPSALAFLGLAALWLAMRRRVAAAALVVGAVVVIAPWTARNVAHYGRFVLIASEGGLTFWTGNHRLSTGEGDMAANPAIKLDYLELRRQHPGASQEQLEPIFYREAFRTIESAPVWWLTLLAKKFVYLWAPVGRSYTLHSRLYYVVTLVSYLLLLPFAVLGFVRLVRGPAQPWALWLLGFSAVALSVLFICTERYRIPVIDPVLIVCAATWFASRTAPSPTPAR